jgi:hypothetical protein
LYIAKQTKSFAILGTNFLAKVPVTMDVSSMGSTRARSPTSSMFPGTARIFNDACAVGNIKLLQAVVAEWKIHLDLLLGPRGREIHASQSVFYTAVQESQCSRVHLNMYFPLPSPTVGLHQTLW